MTGIAIIDAILNGQRDPEALSKLRDPRIKATGETIAAALVGAYRHEPSFTLRQSLTAYQYYQQLIGACDLEIEQRLISLDSKVDILQAPLRKPKDRHKPRRNEMKFDLRNHPYLVFGIDLTEIPGINALTVHVLFAEIGPDLSRFANASTARRLPDGVDGRALDVDNNDIGVYRFLLRMVQQTYTEISVSKDQLDAKLLTTGLRLRGRGDGYLHARCIPHNLRRVGVWAGAGAETRNRGPYERRRLHSTEWGPPQGEKCFATHLAISNWSQYILRGDTGLGPLDKCT